MSDEIIDLASTAVDSRGYIVMMGIISDKRDEKGANVIDWHYKRVRFSIEDGQQALKQFSTFIRNDMEGQYEET